MDALPGHRRRVEARAEVGGCPDGWGVGTWSGRRVVHPAVDRAVPILLVLIFRPPIVLVWGEKKQMDARKDVPLAEQYLQDGWTRGRLISAALPTERLIDHSLAAASERIEKVAWGRTEPRAPAAHPRVSLVVIRSASPAVLHRALGQGCFAVDGAFFPRLARTPAGNCGAKDTTAVGRLVFPGAVVSSTPG